MTEVSVNSAKQIIDYLRTTEALKNDHPRLIATHLKKLCKYDQIEIEENSYGELIYAWAWWMITDKALEDLKKSILPKRFNRGKNMVGFFALIPKADLSIGQMRKIIKRGIRIERAKTFNVFTPRGKWYGISTANFSEQNSWKMMKKSKVEQVLGILHGGNKQCHQQ